MSWFSRVVNVIRRDRLAREFDDEIRFHLEERTEEFTRAGVPADEARARAIRQFGNRAALRDSSGDVRLASRLESLLRDLAFGLRLCGRTKTVTAAAIVSLSLAIGACTAAFSLIDALILRPLPVDDPHSLVYAALRAPADTRDGLSFNYPLFGELREAGRPSVRLFAMSDQSPRAAMFEGADRPDKVFAQWVSGDALGVLGVRAAVGRLIEPSDDLTPGRHPVAVLSYDFWARRFGRNPDVLGRWVTVRERPLQIIGVAERSFTGVEPGIMTDLWAPTMMWNDDAIRDPDTRWFRIWGRMQHGSAVEETRAQLQTVLTNFRRQQAASRPEESRERLDQFINTRVFLRSAAHGPSGLRENFERALWVLAGLAGLVLLMACANVASLLVARAASREREMALRASIGAGRGRLMQQTLIESGLLAVASCVLGAVFAILAAPQIVSILSTSRSAVRLDLQVDWRLLLFLSVAGSLVTFLFGLAPALRVSAISPHDVLQSGTNRHTARTGLFRPLVAAQLAISVVVLFSAGLFLTSFSKLARTDLGFDANNLALVSVEAPGLGHGDAAKALPVWEHLVERLGHSPGIEAVSLSGWGLFEGRGQNKGVRFSGRAADAYMPWYLPVSPGFLETLRIRLVDGRDFAWHDARLDAPTAVIVNVAFARRYFPGESAVGKRFFRVDGGAVLSPQEIIGVAADAKYTDLREPAPATVYDPYRATETAVVELRTDMEAGPLIARLREDLRQVNPAFRVADVTLQSTLIGNHVVRERALALLSAFFSIVAIVLVTVGLYGVLNQSVIQRTREIGIRLAFGARPIGVIALVLSEIGVMTLAGLLAGTAGARVAARFIESLLFEVGPADVRSIVVTVSCVVLACAWSAILPAARATRIDPATVLRHD